MSRRSPGFNGAAILSSYSLGLLCSFRWLKANGDYFIVVIEDVTAKRLAGAATTFIEHKFIRNLGKVSILQSRAHALIQ